MLHIMQGEIPHIRSSSLSSSEQSLYLEYLDLLERFELAVDFLDLLELATECSVVSTLFFDLFELDVESSTVSATDFSEVFSLSLLLDPCFCLEATILFFTAALSTSFALS